MKLTRKILAGVFSAAVMASAAVSVSAADYSDDPSYGEPTYGEVVTDDDIAEAITVATTMGEDNVTITVKDGAEFTKKAIADLQASNKGLNIVADDYAIEISAEEFKKISADSGIDLTVKVTDITDDTKLANNVSIPKDSVMINPALKGEFGFTMKIKLNGSDVPASIHTSNVAIYHVSDAGEVTKDAALLGFSSDNYVYIEINHGSYYVLSAGDVKGADDGKSDTPATGVMLPIALVALAGGAVTVSAVASKKRK